MLSAGNTTAHLSEHENIALINLDQFLIGQSGLTNKSIVHCVAVYRMRMTPYKILIFQLSLSWMSYSYH